MNGKRCERCMKDWRYLLSFPNVFPSFILYVLHQKVSIIKVLQVLIIHIPSKLQGSTNNTLRNFRFFLTRLIRRSYLICEYLMQRLVFRCISKAYIHSKNYWSQILIFWIISDDTGYWISKKGNKLKRMSYINSNVQYMQMQSSSSLYV